MPYHNIDETLSDAKYNATLSFIEDIKGTLPFLINLTPTEIKKLGILRANKLSFVKSAFDFATNNPAILPNNFDQTGWQRDIELLEKISVIKQQTAQLLESLNDTHLAINAEVNQKSLQFFKLAKMQSKLNTPGADTIVDSLASSYGMKGNVGRKKI